jgi:phage terminase Nu1 subunit (DNA packaging protein)
VKVLEAMRHAVTQAEFALIVGVSEAKVSQLVADGVLDRGDTAHQWVVAYNLRLREVAAGRAGAEVGGLDLVQERAALAREQRMGIAIKNAVARKEFAPVSQLGEVLATASQAVSERFEQLPGMLKRACPDLPEAARDQLMTAITSARNEWVARTAQLVVQQLTEMGEGDEEIVDA